MQWTPEALSLPSNVKCAGIGGHELLVLCEDGMIYVWEWRFSRRFKRSHENYQSVVNIRSIALGRSMHLLLQGVLIPQLTEVLSCPETVNSHTPFNVLIQLFDQFGPISYRSPAIAVYFSREKAKTKTNVAEFEMEVRSGDTTELEITVNAYGKYWIHFLVNDCEIPKINFIDVLPSPEDLENAKEEETKKGKETEKDREKTEKNLKAEMDKKKALEAQEEANRRKKEETDKRAQEALKSHREKQEKDKDREEKERKQKLELKTGGGYDLKKRKK